MVISRMQHYHMRRQPSCANIRLWNGVGEFFMDGVECNSIVHYFQIVNARIVIIV